MIFIESNKNLKLKKLCTFIKFINKDIFPLDYKIFEDTERVIRSHKSKNRKHNQVKRKRTHGQTLIYQALHKKLKIEQQEISIKNGVNSGAPEGLAVTVPHVTPVMFLLNNSNSLSLFYLDIY